MPLQAFIVDACRTATGKRNGRISHWHPADLGAVVVDALIERNHINPNVVDDVIFGCVSQIGAQAGNIGRNVVLSSMLPECVPGTSVNRACGSSQQAIHFATQAVMSGTQDIVIAGGVEVMSLIPIFSAESDGTKAGRGDRYSNGIKQRYPNIVFSQFKGAELVAKKYGINRDEMEEFAYQSHKNAYEATQEGRFNSEIVPIQGFDKKKNIDSLHNIDEGIRWPTDVEKLKSLKTILKDGSLTAGTASQISDGASAILICNERGLELLGLKPRAKIIALAVAASDPVTMLDTPILATRKVLSNAGLHINDIDLYEVNEAFASVPLAWKKEINADAKKLNVNGGAIALGHPLGGTGSKLMTTLLNELERRGLRYGLQAICEGGGTANATIIEVIPSTSSKI